MANVKEILERIQSITSMQQITKTMKLISVSKFSRSQNTLKRIKEYDSTLDSMINNIFSEDLTCFVENLIKPRKCKNNALIIPVGSDRGFCGAFNKNVIKIFCDVLKEKKEQYESITIMPIGKKIYSHVKNIHDKVVDIEDNLISKTDDNLLRKCANNIICDYLNGTYDDVVIVYNDFVSATTQNVSVVQMLPFNFINKSKNEGTVIGNCLFEPSEYEVLKELLMVKVRSLFAKCIVSSVTAEHGARMVNMNKANDNADSLLVSLRTLYNQTRQTAVTSEIIEISAGANAING